MRSKQMICLVLVLFLMLFALPVSATEATEATEATAPPVTSGAVGKSASWSFRDGALTISGSGELPDFGFLAPAPWNHLKDSITAVEIGDGITRIGEQAFLQHYYLQRVKIGNAVQSIGARAFMQCTALQAVTIPASVRVIEINAFDNCESLASLTLENGVTSIGNSAFSDNPVLTSVTIPDSVTYIGNYAFNKCTALESVVLGDGLTTLGSHAFAYCSALKTVDFGTNLQTIGTYAFYPCRALTDFELPENLKEIGHWAFFDCVSLTELTIPASVSTVGESAFNGCTGIKKLTIEDGVAAIDTNAFKDCTGIEHLVIPDSVTYMGNSVFSGCTSLTKVTIGTGLTAINNYVFKNCAVLETVKGGDNVETIGTQAFYGCSALQTFGLSEKLTSVGAYAFYNCAALKRVTFYENLTTIGNYAFAGCATLKEVTIPGGVEAIGNFAFSGCSSLQTVEMEEGILSIGNGAFKNCSKLGMDLNPNHPINSNWVEIPDSVTYLGSSAFAGCTLLEDVYFGDGLIEIGSYAFDKCSSLTSLLLPDSVVTVGGSAFSDCDNLNRVFFGKSVETLGSYLFGGSENVKILWFRGDAPEINANAFLTVEAEAIYYAGNATWTEEKRQDYGGTITWIGNWSEDFLDDSLDGDALTERSIRFTAYAREGEAGIGRKLNDATIQSSGEPKDLLVNRTVARNEASQFGVILRNEGYQDYVIPARVAATYQGTDGKAYEFTALMTKFKWLQSDDPYISTVFGRNEGTGESFVEMRSNRLVVSSTVTQEVVITARGFEAQDIIYYIGIPGDTSRQTNSGTGAFTERLLWDLIGDNDTIYVWAESPSTGERTDSMGIRVTRAVENDELVNQFNLGKICILGEDGFKIQLGGDSELFKGMEFDLADFEVPLGAQISNNVMRVSLGIDIFEKGDTKQDVLEKFTKLKAFVGKQGDRHKKAEKAVKAYEQWCEEIKELSKDVGTTVTMGYKEASDFDFKIGAMGYLEYHYSNGQWTLVDGAMGVDGEFKLGHEVQAYVGTPPIIPVTGAIKGGADFGVSGHAIRGVPDRYSPLRFELEIEVTPKISIHAGLGVQDAANGGLYGEGSLPIKWTAANNHLTIAARGVIGAEAEFMGQTYKKDLLDSGEIMLIDRYFGASARTMAMTMRLAYDRTETTVASVMSRDYAQNTSEWLGSPEYSYPIATLATDSPAAAGITFRVLQTSIFSGSNPQLVTVGDRMLLVWSEDCPDRDIYNRMRMVYSVYQPDDNSWSKPAAVWDDGCSDGYAKLVSDGQNTWLLWQKMKTVLTEDTAGDFALMMANAELCLAQFDPTTCTFVNPRMITDNSSYEYVKDICLDNGEPCVFWASAEDNALNTAGVHSITAWRGDQTEIRADSLNYILAIDTLGSEMTYVSDTDGDLATTGDMTAFTMSGTGTTAYDNSETGDAVTYAVYASLNGRQTLFVADMFNIYYQQDGQWHSVFSERRLLGGNLQIVETSLGTTILWTESTEGANALYSVRYRDGGWSEPVQISGGDQILSKVSAVSYDGKLTGVCNTNAVGYDSATGTYTEGETNLCLFQANDFADLVLNYVLAVDEEDLEAGADAEVKVSVTNQGTTDVTEITFTVSDTLGTEVTQTVSVDLPSGETQLVTVAYPVPENYAATTVTIAAATGETDADPEDNTIALELGKMDVALTDASAEFMADAYLIKAIIVNKSLVDAENIILEARMDEADSAPFVIRDVPLVSREKYAAYNLIIPQQAVYFDRNGLAYVYLTLNTGGEDAMESDNTVLIVLEEPVRETEPLPSILGDLDLDDDVDSDDLTLLARHVGGIELVEGTALLNADVNGDGNVDSDDLTKHARYVGGIITDWDQE